MAVSREKLYAEVWAEPMTTVAKRYDVSSNYLARICERLNVPRPGRGYWAQRSGGLEVEQDPLPAADPGAEIEWVRDGSEPKRQPVVLSELIEHRPARAKGDKHSLVRGARAEFEHARESRDEQYVRPYKRNLVDVFVSKDMLDKALEVASDLFIALEEHGHRVMLAPGGAHFRHVGAEICEGHKEQQTFYRGPGSWSPARPTVVLVRDTAFGLTIFEISEEVEVRYDTATSKYVRVIPAKPTDKRQRPRRTFTPAYRDWTTKHWLPSGRLGLHAYAADYHVTWESYWRETLPGELVGFADTVAKALTAAVPKVANLREERAREEERQRQEWQEQQARWRGAEEDRRRQEEERQRKEQEAAREKRFREDMASFRLARDIRSYVAEIRGLVHEAGLEVSKGGNAETELAWALAYADRIDPLASWRLDIAKLRAEAASKPCPDYGEVHGGAPTEEAPDGTEAAESDPMG